MRKIKTAIIILLTLAMTLTAFPSFAEEDKDYSIGDAWWGDYSDTIPMACWDKAESKTGYMVCLYKNGSVDPVTSWISVSGTSYDFSKSIIKKGSGNYTFSVYPKKGDVSMAVDSDVLEVTGSMVSNTKKLLKEESGTTSSSTSKSVADSLGPGASVNGTGADRWLKLADGRWVRQKPDNSLYKNQWLAVDGKWYFFDSNGYMQTGGWKQIGGKWYYFTSDGSILVNTTTPDGYYVDGNGVWANAGGNAGNSGSSKSSSAKTSLNAISSITISASESTGDPGKCMKMELKLSSSGAQVVTQSFSLPYENWSTTTPVMVTAQVDAKNGYYFADNTSYKAGSRLSIIENTGSGTTRNIKLYYSPRKELTQPSGVYVDSGYVLHWSGSDGASYYSLAVKGDSVSSKTYKVTGKSYDLSDYEGEAVKVTLTACSENGSSTKKSEAFVINDLDTFVEENAVEGELVSTKSKTTYTDEYGDKAQGWNKVGGYWYYFNKGTAVGPGWFQDPADGNWFYFDTNRRMRTGYIIDNGTSYFMNDGSNGAYPVGAWVQ